MFRRIELISQMSAESYHALIERLQQQGDESTEHIHKDNPRFWKSGLMGYGNPVVWDAWADMNSPRRPVNRNARFYFSEEG